MTTDRRRKARLRKLSKFLSLLLRHRPARFPIALDAAGYADLGEVMHILNGLPNFRWATRRDIEAVIQSPGRRRFEITVDAAGQEHIRALYGHTAIRPTYEAVVPPDLLYHGTIPESLDAIYCEGLRPTSRQYVHLAVDIATARSIALRHTHEPMVLQVDTRAAHAGGIAFYHPVEAIYLTAAVPPVYLKDRVE